MSCNLGFHLQKPDRIDISKHDLESLLTMNHSKEADNPVPTRVSNLLVHIVYTYVDHLQDMVTESEMELSTIELALEKGGYSLKKQTLDERQFHKKHLNLQHLLQVIDYGEHVFFKVKDTCAQRTWFAREDIRELEVLVARLRWLKEHVGLTVNRVTAIQTDLDSWQAEQVNRKFYYLSLLSVIFLPLSIITGVFGMNVGGVPWTGQKDPTLKHGFRNVLLICAAILVPFLSYFGTIIRNHGLTMKTEHTDFIRWPKWFLHISENFMESDASRGSYPSLKASPSLPE